MLLTTSCKTGLLDMSRNGIDVVMECLKPKQAFLVSLWPICTMFIIRYFKMIKQSQDTLMPREPHE